MKILISPLVEQKIKGFSEEALKTFNVSILLIVGSAEKNQELSGELKGIRLYKYLVEEDGMTEFWVTYRTGVGLLELLSIGVKGEYIKSF